MGVSNTWRRQAQAQGAAHNSSAVLSRLVGFSMAFWILVGALALVFGTRAQVTPSFSLAFFGRFTDTLHTLKVCAFVLALNAFSGAVCALPAVGLLLIARRPPDMIQRKPNRFRLIQRWVGRAFPYGVLVLSHLVLFSLGLGAAPQWSRSLSRESNPLAEYSRFVNDLFFYPIETESTRDRWQRALKGPDAPRAIVLFAPSSLLSHAAGLVKIKRSLGEPLRFFADSASVPAFFAELFYAEESANLAFHLPVPDDFALRGAGGFLKDNGPSLGVEWNEAQARPENLLVRFAPEWKAVENVIEGDAAEARGMLDLRTAAALRLLQSQVPLFLLARFDAFRLIEPAARWTQLVADDTSIMEEALNGAAITFKKSQGRGLAFVQLSEQERALGEVVPPFAPLRWPASLSSTEERWLVKKFDGLLGFGFSVVSGPQAPLVFLVPYPDGESRSQLTHAFVRARQGQSTEDVVPAKLGTGFLTVDDVTLVMRQALGVPGGRAASPRSSPVQGNSPAAALHCERHFTDLSSLLSDEHVPGIKIQESYWNAVGRYSDARLEFPSALSFLSGSGFEHSVICRPTREADGKSFDTSQSWIIRWVRQEESDIIFRPPSGAAQGELRRALVRAESDAPRPVKKRLDPREQQRRDRTLRLARRNEDAQAAGDRARYLNYELFRLAPDVQSGIVLRRATQVERGEFFKRWGAQVDMQFEQGARAQLH